MKKDKINIILVLIFVIGLSVMLYPTISDYWNSRTQSRAIATYSDTVEHMDTEDKEALLEKAREYNRQLASLSNPFTQSELLNDEYMKTLDVSGTGIMGYVTISSIGVELPIYHGTSEAILQVACGHLEGSSLPVGGSGTHCVISAHRGLPSAKLFTDLDQLVEGDTFKITVLGQTVTYMVDQIRIVLPQEIDDLKMDPNEDYCTLMTCTPYGINSHRLLVRGVRTQNAKEEKEVYVAAEAHQVNTNIVAIVIAVIILVLLVLLVKIMHLIQKVYQKKKGKHEKTG